MTAFELGGVSEEAVSASVSLFQYYSNGILKLSPKAEDLLSLLPASWHGGSNVRILQETLGLEYETVVRSYLDLQAQLFIPTATWGLQLWEEMLGLPIQSGLTAAEIALRRTRVQIAMARESQNSELHLQQGIATLAGIGPEEIATVTLDPRTDKYTVRIEIPVAGAGFAPPPATAPTLTEVNYDAAGTPVTWEYAVSYMYRSGETVPGPSSSIVVEGINGVVYVQLANIPVGPSDVQFRRIYRRIGAAAWESRGLVHDNVSTTYKDDGTEPFAETGGGLPLAVPTARTELALQIDDYIARTKPAHLRITTPGVGFQADFGQADVTPL